MDADRYKYVNSSQTDGRDFSKPEIWKAEILKRFERHEYDCIPCLRLRAGIVNQARGSKAALTNRCAVRNQLFTQIEICDNAIANQVAV